MKFIRKLLNLLSPRERTQAGGLLALFLLMAFSEVAGIASILPFMSVLSNPDAIQNNEWLNKAYSFFGFTSPSRFLFFIGIGVLIILVITNVIKAITKWATLYVTQTWGENLSCRLFDVYLRQPYQFFLGRNSSDLSKNILAEVQIITNSIIMSTLDLTTKIIVSTTILVFLAIIDPLLALVTFTTLGGIYGLVFLTFRKSLREESVRRKNAQTEKFKTVSEAIQGIKNIKLGGYETLYSKYFAQPARDFSVSSAKSNVIGEIPRFALEIIAFGGILLMTLYLLLKSPQGIQQALPMIALYAFAGYRLMPSMQGIYQSFTRIKFHQPVLDMIAREISLSSQCQNALEKAPPSLSFKGQIEFKRVCYRYDGSDKDILKSVDAHIPVDSITGIVGKTGAGKTTFVDLLLGLLEPTEGHILVDGICIDDINRKAWQKNLSYVSQHIYLCDDTIAANIAFGIHRDEVDLDKVRLVAKMASLLEFIENELPKKYDTIIGENGIRLSGGQRQRIGLARALYLDRPVLVLDESTSALDPDTEQDVMESIYSLDVRKTIVIISHKVELLQRCDNILIVQNGIVQRFEKNQSHEGVKDVYCR